MPATQTAGAVRAEPNVTPMIDVMLVLLVIFMLVVPALAAGTTAEPPRGEHLTAHPAEDGDPTLAIDARGGYALNGRPVTRAALPAALRALLASRADDRVLYVTADRGLDYAAVQEALAVATASGARVVGLVAEQGARAPR